MVKVTATDTVDQAENWMLYLYMSSENNLKAQSVRNINDIRKFIGLSATNAVIYQDLKDETNFEFLPSTKTRPPKSLGGMDFSSAATLNGFLDDAGVEKAGTGKQQMLILWGHGRGMLFLPDDEAPQQPMDVISAAAVLTGSSAHKFDIIGFDACFMCVLEVVNDFAGACKYFVSSPSLIPSTGWAYAEMLQAIGKLKTAPNAEKMSAIISTTYESRYQAQFPESRLIQLSTIETHKLPDLIAAFQTLGEEIARILDDGGQSAETLRKSLTLARQIALTAPGAFDYVDGVDLITRLQGLMPKGLSLSLDAACENFLSRAIGIFKEERDVPSFLIWFPLQRGIYARWRGLYDKLNTSRKSGTNETVGWALMLSKYHGLSSVPAEDDDDLTDAENRIFMALRHREKLKPQLEKITRQRKERING